MSDEDCNMADPRCFKFGITTTTTSSSTSTTSTSSTTTTTTTNCHLGIFDGSIALAASYTPTAGGSIDFHATGQDACNAIYDVMFGGGGTWNNVDYDLYTFGPYNYVYYPGTCDLIADGFYVWDNGTFVVEEINGGIMMGIYSCTTTTTTIGP